MEVDSLKSMGYGVTPGTDYATKTVSSTVVEKKDKGESRTGRAENIKNTQSNQGTGDSKTFMPDSLDTEMPKLEENISNEFFEKFLQEANKRIFATNRQFDYSIHEETNRVIVRVLDRITKEVIKEIPPEKTLDAAAKMLELVGVIIDEKI